MLMQEQLKEMVKNANAAGWRLKPAEQIKKKALDKAISLYAKEAKNEYIYAFMDNTIMGSGKTGFLLTDRAIYCPDFNYSKASNGKHRVSLENIVIFGQAEEGEKYFQFLYSDGTKQLVFCLNTYREGFLALVQTALGVYEWEHEEETKTAINESECVVKNTESVSENTEETESVQILDEKGPLAYSDEDIESLMESAKEEFYDDSSDDFVSVFQELAYNNNHAESWHMLGLCYYEGRGLNIDSDVKRAKECFKKSADLGYTDAQYWLYRCDYEHFLYLSKNNPESLKKEGIDKTIRDLHTAADHNDIGGIFYLAKYYYYGIGVKRDSKLAKLYLQKAADMGRKAAEVLLAYWFYDWDRFFKSKEGKALYKKVRHQIRSTLDAAKKEEDIQLNANLDELIDNSLFTQYALTSDSNPRHRIMTDLEYDFSVEIDEAYQEGCSVRDDFNYDEASYWEWTTVEDVVKTVKSHQLRLDSYDSRKYDAIIRSFAEEELADSGDSSSSANVKKQGNIPQNEDKTVKDKVYKILYDYCDGNFDMSMPIETDLYNTLGLESLDMLELMSEFEEACDIEMPAFGEEFQTIKDIIEYVEKKM